jgi:hypothetical protein
LIQDQAATIQKNRRADPIVSSFNPLETVFIHRVEAAVLRP